MSSLQSNTNTALNDKQGPIILTATIAPQNSYVDITFSEGVYGTVSPSTAVTSPSFTLSQQSRPELRHVFNQLQLLRKAIYLEEKLHYDLI